MSAPSVPVGSFKLRFDEAHVRIVPTHDGAGCPFAGPGVDLRGAPAAEAFALAQPIVAWFEALEPVTIRSLSFDLRKPRILATVRTPGAVDERPRVVRIDGASDPASAAELTRRAAPLVARLGELAHAQLRRRAPA